MPVDTHVNKICDNCGEEFPIYLPSAVGHEGACPGYYIGGAQNVLVDMSDGKIYPFCPDCKAVDLNVYWENHQCT